jgi:peptidyl-prolyl cis-trans isomerase A (cyclophilin A)
MNMKTIQRFAAIVLASGIFALTAGAQQTTPPPPTAELPDAPGTQVKVSPQPTGPTAVLDTSMGRMSCQLFDKQAPLAVANFIALADGTKTWTNPATSKKMVNKPLYNGTIFHRVIPDFMIQGGDPVGTGMGDPGYLFKDEFDSNLNFDVPGRLAMANSGPGTNGSQFFITLAPTEHLNQVHTIFGQCDEASITVAKAIAAVPRDDQDKPVTDVVLKKVTIVREGQPMPPLPATPAVPADAKPAAKP